MFIRLFLSLYARAIAWWSLTRRICDVCDGRRSQRTVTLTAPAKGPRVESLGWSRCCRCRGTGLLSLALGALALLAVGCRTPPPRSQLETASAVVSGAEILTKIACDDGGLFGRVHPLTLEAPALTLDGVVQAVRSYLCADVFEGLLSDARTVIRRAERASAAESDTPTAVTPPPAPDPSPGAPDDAGPPPTAATDAGTVTP